MSAVCPQLDLIQTVSLPDDPPWKVQKPHIDLYLTHQKKHLGDDCFFQSLFAQLKSCYPDHRAVYTDGSKAENRLLQLLHVITSVPRSDFLAMLVYSQLNYRLVKWLLILLKILIGIVLSYSLILYLVFKLLIATTYFYSRYFKTF